MGNNKEESARREGMAYALRIAKEKGIEALEKELEFRNITNIPIKISKGQVEAFVEETKQTMFDTILLMSCYSLRDAFGFGNKRLMDFKNKFSEYTMTKPVDMKEESLSEVILSLRCMIVLMQKKMHC